MVILTETKQEMFSYIDWQAVFIRLVIFNTAYVNVWLQLYTVFFYIICEEIIKSNSITIGTAQSWSQVWLYKERRQVRG